MLWPKKNSYKEFDNEKIFLRLENTNSAAKSGDNFDNFQQFSTIFSGCYAINCRATIIARQLSVATILLCFDFYRCRVDVLQS